jgi:selenide,water dikinase
VRVPAGRDLVLTADVIAPLVDDPATFGAIAAANSLSDVWAMGGEPRFALNLTFFPDDQLPLEVLDAILEGAMRICVEAGVAVVGGHSVRDPEVKFGLSVTGDVGPGELWTNRTARAGQTLVLTKAIGTGVIGQAIKKGLASEAAAGAAIRSLAAALCPGGSKANRAHVAPDTAWADGAPLLAEPAEDSARELLASLACDAQTSGGLLLCIPAANAPACVEELRAAGLPAAAIGALREPGAGPSITLAP